MDKIERLSSHISNMIAAGEVIERPMSVVKELVENSIDAKASNIVISLENGGLSLIKVADNGIGMSPNDAALCFMRHATSKIHNEYDLFRINTLGFRGEAIPSIAAVSIMEIATNDGTTGSLVRYKAGVCDCKETISKDIGTTVSVKNLFYNTPARLKYLKSESREYASITYMVERFALSNPSISFSLLNNGNQTIFTSGNGDYTRLFGDIYGLNVAKNLINSTFSGNGYDINFVLAKPEVYRANKLEITLVVNGRYVKNKNITNAVIEAYTTNLPIGKYPVGVIYLTVDPLLIDVNVHPTKMEIKISNEEEIINALIKVIEESIGNVVQIPEIDVLSKAYSKESIFDSMNYEINDSTVKYKNVTNDIKEQNEDINFIKEEEATPLKMEKRLPYMEYVGQVFGTYLIFQNSSGMYLVDQHAAQERIRYEHYVKILGDANQPRSILLMPLVLEFTKTDMEYLRGNIDKLAELGFKLELAGENSYFVREIPAWANTDNTSDDISFALKLFIDNKEVSVIKFRDAIAKRIACKTSIKANKRLSNIEIDKLISDLGLCNNPYHCPHGRPTIVTLSELELEKMFKRVI